MNDIWVHSIPDFEVILMNQQTKYRMFFLAYDIWTKKQNKTEKWLICIYSICMHLLHKGYLKPHTHLRWCPQWSLCHKSTSSYTYAILDQSLLQACRCWLFDVDVELLFSIICICIIYKKLSKSRSLSCVVHLLH